MNATQNIVGVGYNISLDWHSEGYPVIYVVGHGRIREVSDALDIILKTRVMIESMSFQTVCVVFNLLDIQNLPFMGRIIGSKQFLVSPRVDHVVIATFSQSIQLVVTMVGVAANPNLRSVEICDSLKTMETAVTKWLARMDYSVLGSSS